MQTRQILWCGRDGDRPPTNGCFSAPVMGEYLLQKQETFRIPHLLVLVCLTPCRVSFRMWGFANPRCASASNLWTCCDLRLCISVYSAGVTPHPKRVPWGSAPSRELKKKKLEMLVIFQTEVIYLCMCMLSILLFIFISDHVLLLIGIGGWGLGETEGDGRQLLFLLCFSLVKCFVLHFPVQNVLHK